MEPVFGLDSIFHKLKNSRIDAPENSRKSLLRSVIVDPHNMQQAVRGFDKNRFFPMPPPKGVRRWYGQEVGGFILSEVF